MSVGGHGVPVHRDRAAHADASARGTSPACSRELHQRKRGTDGESWDIAILKIHRDTAQLVMNFVSGEAAEMWRITPPENIGNLSRIAAAPRRGFEAV